MTTADKPRPTTLSPLESAMLLNKPMFQPMTTAANPRRKFYLLVALNKALGVDVARRELSVRELESIAAANGVDLTEVPA
jgi:hypothetical protein